MFEALGRFSVRFRWVIILFWIIAAPVAIKTLPSLSTVSKSDNSQFLPSSSPSAKASKLEAAFRGKHSSGTMTIVASEKSGVLTSTDAATINRAIQTVARTPGVTTVKDQGMSQDSRAQELIVGVANANPNQIEPVVTSIRAQLQQYSSSNLDLHLTGILAQSYDSSNASSKGRSNTQSYSLILIIILLFIVFRSLLAPFITLIPAALALIIAGPVIAEASKLGLQVSSLTQILLIVLLLGAGTDYGLFLVFRMREELEKGTSSKEAVIKALGRVGESITFSAATVAAALVSLLLASFGLYKGLGPGLAIGLVIMLLVALTFLPAVLSIFGRGLFWPSKVKIQPLKIGLWGRLAEHAIRHPILMIVIAAVIFGGLSAGLFGYKTTGFSNGGAPATSDSAIGQQIINQHYPAANYNPQQLILQFSTSVWRGNNLQAVQSAQNKLKASGYFQSIQGPFHFNGYNFNPQQLHQLHQQEPNNPVLRPLAQIISSDGRTVQFSSVLKNAPSGSNKAVSEVLAVRTEMQKVAVAVGAESGSLYSSDAQSYDTQALSNNDLKKIIPLVLMIIAILLIVMLRSLVAPWYLIFTVGLSYIATLGFAMFAFVHLGHQEGINFVLPFMLFIFSMALGEDYNILVMSRIREESHEHSLTEAIPKAVGITGSTVTSAGIILAGTFGVLGLVGGASSSQLQQIGISIAFGILLDTFFVRTLLVPSIASMLGRYNWWPTKLSRTN